MECFLTRARTRSSTVPRVAHTAQGPRDTANMADRAPPSQQGSTSPLTQHSQTEAVPDYKTIAEAVAALLQPSIVQAVEQALSTALTDLQKEVRNISHAIQDLEQRIVLVEEENAKILSSQADLEKINAELREILDDLENRSRRNNVRIIGLLEEIKSAALFQFCQSTLTQLLNITSDCLWREHTGWDASRRKIHNPGKWSFAISNILTKKRSYTNIKR